MSLSSVSHKQSLLLDSDNFYQAFIAREPGSKEAMIAEKFQEIRKTISELRSNNHGKHSLNQEQLEEFINDSMTFCHASLLELGVGDTDVQVLDLGNAAIQIMDNLKILEGGLVDFDLSKFSRLIKSVADKFQKESIKLLIDLFRENKSKNPAVNDLTRILNLEHGIALNMFESQIASFFADLSSNRYDAYSVLFGNNTPAVLYATKNIRQLLSGLRLIDEKNSFCSFISDLAESQRTQRISMQEAAQLFATIGIDPNNISLTKLKNLKFQENDLEKLTFPQDFDSYNFKLNYSLIGTDKEESAIVAITKLLEEYVEKFKYDELENLTKEKVRNFIVNQQPEGLDVHEQIGYYHRNLTAYKVFVDTAVTLSAIHNNSDLLLNKTAKEFFESASMLIQKINTSLEELSKLITAEELAKYIDSGVGQSGQSDSKGEEKAEVENKLLEIIQLSQKVPDCVNKGLAYLASAELRPIYSEYLKISSEQISQQLGSEIKNVELSSFWQNASDSLNEASDIYLKLVTKLIEEHAQCYSNADQIPEQIINQNGALIVRFSYHGFQLRETPQGPEVTGVFIPYVMAADCHDLFADKVFNALANFECTDDQERLVTNTNIKDLSQWILVFNPEMATKILSSTAIRFAFEDQMKSISDKLIEKVAASFDWKIKLDHKVEFFQVNPNGETREEDASSLKTARIVDIRGMQNFY
jgi:hypothetical protein